MTHTTTSIHSDLPPGLRGAHPSLRGIVDWAVIVLVASVQLGLTAVGDFFLVFSGTGDDSCHASTTDAVQGDLILAAVLAVGLVPWIVLAVRSGRFRVPAVLAGVAVSVPTVFFLVQAATTADFWSGYCF